MKVLVIQGAGMELRGKTDVEIFGPETLPEIDARIEADAAQLGMTVEIRQSNDEAEAASWVDAAVGVDHQDCGAEDRRLLLVGDHQGAHIAESIKYRRQQRQLHPARKHQIRISTLNDFGPFGEAVIGRGARGGPRPPA